MSDKLELNCQLNLNWFESFTRVVSRISSNWSLNGYLDNWQLYYTDNCILFVNYCRLDESRQPLSRKVAIPSSKLNPYRMVVVARFIIMGLFLQYRVTHPVQDAIGLWLTSVICEIWFAFSWIFDQLPKWLPIQRETYLDRLSIRYDSKIVLTIKGEFNLSYLNLN